MAQSTKIPTKSMKQISVDVINSDFNPYFHANSELNQFNHATAFRGNFRFTFDKIQFCLYCFGIIDILNGVICFLY